MGGTEGCRPTPPANQNRPTQATSIKEIIASLSTASCFEGPPERASLPRTPPIPPRTPQIP